jgi:hypothetical protein
MSKNHLIPQSVMDSVDGMTNPSNSKNTRDNFQIRVEAIKDYCSTSLQQRQILIDTRKKKLPNNTY